MTAARPRFAAARGSVGLLAASGIIVLLATLAAPLASAAPAPTRAAGVNATALVEMGPVPSEVGVGVPTGIAWEALDTHGVRVPTFAAAGALSILEGGNGSSAPAWVNSSVAGPLGRSVNGSFSIPSAAWSDGVLGLSVDLGVSGPVSVRLFGPLLPPGPGPIPLTVLPDFNHLVLYGPKYVQNNLSNESRSYSAFWHVRDRFGDPAPGATLLVEFSTGSAENQTAVPVVWTTGGVTGAWVNYSAQGPAGGILTVVDGAGTALLPPMTVAAVANGTATNSRALSPLALAGVALLAVGGLGGVGALLYGGRPKPTPAPTGEEEELRRLAEGRATVVELLRRAGPLPLHELEARWEPAPAPPALADWVASLVADGTLTATLGEGGRARFALAERPTAEPRVTLDEEALERGIARRDAAVAPADEGGAEPEEPK